MTIKVNVPKKAFNDVYYPHLNCNSRYLILYGGAGSGKSVFAAQRYILKLLKPTRCNILAVRQIGNTLRDSVFAELRKIIKAWKLEKLFKVSQSDMRIVGLNGNEVLFRGLDDVEKLKSVTFVSGELTDIWVEEASEVAEDDFKQLDVRLRGGKSDKQIVVTFNPIDVNHWLKRRFFDETADNVTVVHTTYKDNRFLDEDYKRLLESYRETDSYYYDVYCRGMWGVFGKTIFNAQAVNDRLQANPTPLERGFFVSNKWCADDTGDIAIYEKPKVGYPYVVGCDTAGEGCDYAVAQVIDNVSGKQVAVYRTTADEDLFAEQVMSLGYYYNTALVGIEANFSTYPIRRLQEKQYPRQYMRETEDKITHTPQKIYGFKTTSVTRPLILSNLIALMRENIANINDKDTLFEMLTFVRNSKGRMEAQQGAHDDLIMSLAIAYYIAGQQSNGVKVAVVEDDFMSYFNFENKDGQFVDWEGF